MICNMINILLFFDVSGGEILIILLVVFLLFGPEKLPGIAKKIGKVVFEFKQVTQRIKTEIDQEIYEDEAKKEEERINDIISKETKTEDNQTEAK
jgi:sec-independent protein translocase protein TatA